MPKPPRQRKSSPPKAPKRAPREIHSRPLMERILRIHQLVEDGRYPNCTTLGRELEACARTIMRDLDFMRDRLQLPIMFDSNRNGYYYTEPVTHFPQIPMSEAETFAVLVAHKAIVQYRGTPFQRPLETAFQRLTGQLDRRVRFSLGSLDQVLSFRPFAPDDADLRAFEALTQALRERRVIRFEYRNRGVRTAQRRLVRPYHLACIDHHWYLIAFDVRRQGLRTFALTRMRRPELCREHFKPDPNFDANRYLSGSFNVFKGRDDYEIVIEFDPWAADEVRGRRWHESQELIELPNGCVRLRLRLNNIEEVERWVLSFGNHATVIRPRALIQRIGAIGKELARRSAQV